MQKRPTSIFNLFLLGTILVSAYFQSKSPQMFSSVNDLCQDHLSVVWLKNLQPAYQLFSHSQCEINNKYLPTQYNAHPPTSLIFFYPLAFLSLAQATLLWDIFSIFCYFISLTLLLIIARLYTFKNLALVFTISTIWITINLNYAVRNLSILLLLLTSLYFVSLIQKKYYHAGFFLGIAILIKFWPAVLIIPLFFYSHLKKTISAAVLTIFFGIGTTLFLFGVNTFSDYNNKVVPFEKIFINYPNNNSLTSSLIKILKGVDPHRNPPLL